jgi:hypothetical protein
MEDFVSRLGRRKKSQWNAIRAKERAFVSGVAEIGVYGSPVWLARDRDKSVRRSRGVVTTALGEGNSPVRTARAAGNVSGVAERGRCRESGPGEDCARKDQLAPGSIVE